MSGRKDFINRKFATTLSMLAVLFVVSSCAGSSSAPDAPAGETPPSDSTLLDDASKVGATDVSESAAFGDLDSSGAKKTEETTDAAATASAPAADGDTFYSSVGGESLRRVAFTLYSDKSFAKKLLEKNPDLKGVKKLSAEQKVFFDMELAKPEPTYLTKDLLNRYTASLADRLNASVSEKGITKTTVTVNKGESLQDVSQRLYGTHRYWTEIFLVNHDKIQNFDKVKAGMTLSVFNRPNTGVAKTEPSTPAAVAISEEPVAPAPKEVAPPPVVAPVAVTTPEPTPLPVISQPEPPVVQAKDPIPETPPPAPAPVVATPPPAAPVAIEMPKPLPKVEAVVEPTSANSSLRRILYVVLILAIGGAAFYFTRTPKRPKPDMLDLNADAGARPKLAAKDSQKHNIG